MEKMQLDSKNGWSVLAVALLIPLWFLAHRYSTFIGDPIEVATALPAFLTDGATWQNIGYTMFRVYSGLVIGVAAGTLAAFAMNRNMFLNQLLSTYVTVGLRTPSAIAAIVALALFKKSEYGYVVVVAFITFPYLATGLLSGLKSADEQLDEMARIYHLGTIKHARHVLLPFIAPYAFSAVRNVHALAWKVIVAVEIFGAAQVGFGVQFQNAWDYFLITKIHLWLLVFVAIVIVVEYCLLRPLERWAFQWRAA